MRVPRLTRFALTTWSISTFTCKYYPFDSSNGFWKINMIQQLVSTCAPLLEKMFLHILLIQQMVSSIQQMVSSFLHMVSRIWQIVSSIQQVVSSIQQMVSSIQQNSFQYAANSFQYLANSFQYLANGLQNLANGFYLCKKQFLDFTEMANKEANALHNIYIHTHTYVTYIIYNTKTHSISTFPPVDLGKRMTCRCVTSSAFRHDPLGCSTKSQPLL